jgi:hypothetical protein
MSFDGGVKVTLDVARRVIGIKHAMTGDHCAWVM